MFHYRSICSLALLLLAACASPTKTPDAPERDVTQNPAPTSNDTSSDVQFAAAGMAIHGTIDRPPGDGPYPAVVLVAGSGPTDRDWKNPLLPGDNGSAALLADALVERGVVVLRYDKRGTGATGMPSTPVTWSDYTAEIAEGVRLLASLDYVDDRRIHVAGHSEGGAHAMRLAQDAPRPLASIILLSTAGRSLRDIVVWQIGAQIHASGLNPQAAEAEITALEGALDAIGNGETIDPTKVGQLPGVQQFLAALQNPQSVDFARELLVFDPGAAVAEIDLPILILSGARDIQVDPQLDAAPIAEAARAAGRQTELVIVPTADHVLKHEETPRDQLDAAAGFRYNAEGRTLADGVVDAIANWILDTKP